MLKNKNQSTPSGKHTSLQGLINLSCVLNIVLNIKQQNSISLTAKLSYIYRTKIVSAQTQLPKTFQCNILSIKTDATLTLICSLLTQKTFWTIPWRLGRLSGTKTCRSWSPFRRFSCRWRRKIDIAFAQTLSHCLCLSFSLFYPSPSLFYLSFYFSISTDYISLYFTFSLFYFSFCLCLNLNQIFYLLLSTYFCYLLYFYTFLYPPLSLCFFYLPFSFS